MLRNTLRNNMDKEQIEKEIQEIEGQMSAPDFWEDKRFAQEVINRYQELKDEKEGLGKYDKGDAVITIFAGAGGQDSEDFVRILYNMYSGYISSKGWTQMTVHEHSTDHGGYRNITFEVIGSRSYGTLKNESGVHRLVRISPFDSNKKRHTSFAMVEVVPSLPDVKSVEIDESELEIEFSKSSGPGGQNVNKRETAVRIVHTPTGISAQSDSERTQEANRVKALSILSGKLYHKREEDRKKVEKGLSVSANTANEWGSQIRSYVFHPYQMVKDHRTDVEVRSVDSVLDGDIEAFIEAEREL